eukprot:TRINITY_DN375_c0_g1_i12.p1 TRINITY_DN375_c0_g1~~TRINITY_DN375_c0_g1_i12.p1  ORF type:complete len:462 (-),score=102.01 TRINITY_DN375_c0_g1_i12:2255-3640(-)
MDHARDARKAVQQVRDSLEQEQEEKSVLELSLKDLQLQLDKAVAESEKRAAAGQKKIKALGLERTQLQDQLAEKERELATASLRIERLSSQVAQLSSQLGILSIPQLKPTQISKPIRQPTRAAIPETPRGPSVGFLKIHLIGAINVKAADMGGTSDPFVNFQCGKAEINSNYVEKSLSPFWNQLVSLPVYKRDDALMMKLMDHNERLSHTQLGIGACQIRDLLPSTPTPKEVEFVGDRGTPAGMVFFTLTMTVVFALLAAASAASTAASQALIVTFMRYAPSSEFEQLLGACLPEGEWRVVRRDNPATALPTDFLLVSCGLPECPPGFVDLLRSCADVKRVSPERRLVARDLSALGSVHRRHTPFSFAEEEEDDGLRCQGSRTLKQHGRRLFGTSSPSPAQLYSAEILGIRAFEAEGFAWRFSTQGCDWTIPNLRALWRGQTGLTRRSWTTHLDTARLLLA